MSKQPIMAPRSVFDTTIWNWRMSICKHSLRIPGVVYSLWYAVISEAGKHRHWPLRFCTSLKLLPYICKNKTRKMHPWSQRLTDPRNSSGLRKSLSLNSKISFFDFIMHFLNSSAVKWKVSSQDGSRQSEMVFVRCFVRPTWILQYGSL